MQEELSTPDQFSVIILGAGLAGLTLAYRLRQKGIDALVLEARERPGGRIETITHEGTNLELGATWFADKHLALNKLLKALNIEKVVQDYGKNAVYEMADGQASLYPLPDQPELTYRIKGGSSALINRLVGTLLPNQVRLNEPVRSLEFSENEVTVTSSKDRYKTSYVVNTLPPHLMAEKIAFIPPLPEECKNLCNTTHTWMGESIKAGLFSPKAFWYEREIGTVYSQRGPVTEMYDHSSEKGHALKGFVHDGYAQLSCGDREKAVKAQLTRFFGSALDATRYADKVWSEDQFTFTPYPSDVFPHQNNGHPSLRRPYYQGRLMMAGSETAQAFPGYMDGAVEAAENTALHLLALLEAKTV